MAECFELPCISFQRLLLLLVTLSLVMFYFQYDWRSYLVTSSTALHVIQLAQSSFRPTNVTAESSHRYQVAVNRSDSHKNDIVYQEAEVILKKFLPQIFERVPKPFLPEYKNPCWFEEDKLKCLPYFYQIGSYKSATSDLWDKLVQHPNVADVMKEPHWWAWRRFGYTGLPCHGDMVKKIRALTGEKDDSSFDWYLNWFEYQLNGSLQRNHELVFGDASITTLWGIADGKATYTEPEPIYVLADIIHALQPNAKIFAILRNPLDRAMSEYLYSYKDITKKPEQFHAEVERSLARTKSCLDRQQSARACAFSLKIGNWRDFVPLHGAYYLYLKEWIRVYGRERVLVLRTEDWIGRPAEVLTELIDFLEIEPLSEDSLKPILHRKVKNTRKTRRKQFEKMLNKTRTLLEEFYRPWNDKLVNLLGDSKFSWDI